MLTYTLVETNSSVNGRKAHSNKKKMMCDTRNLANYPARELMDLGGEPTTTIFLNQQHP